MASNFSNAYVLAHEYLGVDVIMVWETVTAYIEPLQQTLEQILDG